MIKTTLEIREPHKPTLANEKEAKIWWEKEWIPLEEHQAKIKELEVETAKGIEEGLKFYKPKTIELQQEICKLKEEIRWLKVAKLNKAIEEKNE